MKLVKNKWIQVILLTVFLLLFLRVDFRFKYRVECCSDDYDYYLHASTIAFDFDLDYSNQDVRGFSYFKNNKTTDITVQKEIVKSSKIEDLAKNSEIHKRR